MTGFIVGVALGYCAAALLPAGLTHLHKPITFARLIAGHGLFAPRVARVVALATGTVEVLLGAGALAVFFSGALAWPLLGAALLIGIAFVAYLVGLLRRPHSAVGCGCTPFAGPVTPASLLPGAGLAAVSALALPSSGSTAVQVALFGVVCGVTLAGAFMLVPGSVPLPADEPRST